MVFKTLKSEAEVNFQLDCEEYLGSLIMEWSLGPDAEEAVTISEVDAMNLARSLWRNLWWDKLKKSTVVTLGDGHELDETEIDVEIQNTGEAIHFAVLDPEPEEDKEGMAYPAEGYGFAFELYKGEMRVIVWAGGDDPDWNGEAPTHIIPFRNRKGGLPTIRKNDAD